MIRYALDSKFNHAEYGKLKEKDQPTLEKVIREKPTWIETLHRSGEILLTHDAKVMLKSWLARASRIAKTREMAAAESEEAKKKEAVEEVKAEAAAESDDSVKPESVEEVTESVKEEIKSNETGTDPEPDEDTKSTSTSKKSTGKKSATKKSK